MGASIWEGLVGRPNQRAEAEVKAPALRLDVQFATHVIVSAQPQLEAHPLGLPLE